MSKRVYFIEAGDGGPIKIGVAGDVAKRFKALQATNPIPLRLLAIIDGGHADERRLHKRFASERLRGEWFRGDGAVRAFAVSMASASADEIAVALAPEPPKPRHVRERKPKKERPASPRKRRATNSRRVYSHDEWYALFYVCDSGSVFRSGEAEAYLVDQDDRRRAVGLAPVGFGAI